MSDPRQDESFKIVDRRLFTPEGEFRKEVAEQQDREHNAASAIPTVPAAAPARTSASGASKAEKLGVESPAQSVLDTPKRSLAFENLVRSLGQNAAMLLGGYPDPRTGQPLVDLEGAREMIDMLDGLREKTLGNLAPEEETLIIDILGNLKLAFMEVTKATAVAAAPDSAKSR